MLGCGVPPLSRAVVNIGQVVPPVAMLSIAVPLVGFESMPRPCPQRIALVLYGLLPIFENTISSLAGVSATVREAHRCMDLDGR